MVLKFAYSAIHFGHYSVSTYPVPEIGRDTGTEKITKPRPVCPQVGTETWKISP